MCGIDARSMRQYSVTPRIGKVVMEIKFMFVQLQRLFAICVGNKQLLI